MYGLDIGHASAANQGLRSDWLPVTLTYFLRSDYTNLDYIVLIVKVCGFSHTPCRYKWCAILFCHTHIHMQDIHTYRIEPCIEVKFNRSFQPIEWSHLTILCNIVMGDCCN